MCHNSSHISSPYAVIDLHLHLDGSLSLASVKQLAAMQNIPLPETDTEILHLLQVSPNCRDLNEYLEKFAFPCSLLQTEEGLRTAVYNLCEELQAQGLLYAEIRFAPQLHTEKGLTQAEVTAAAIAGMQKSDFRANLILCCMRGNDNLAENLETIRTAKTFLGKGVCAADLAGAEALFPTDDFEDVFALAAALGVPFTLHAGEADGAASVSKALAFGASRIGHGVRSIEDPAVLQYLSKTGIALELCPTSNLQTNMFQTLAEYPIHALLDAGVTLTLNTDNMSVSHTTLAAEYQQIADTFHFTEKELQRFALNAAEASFAAPETKQYLKQMLQNCFK